MDNKNIGAFIHQLRIDKGMTQQELAEKIGVTNKAISKWECGRGCPDISMLEILSELLEVSVIELLNGQHFTTEPPQQEVFKTSIDYSDKLVKENNHQLNTRMFLLGIGLLFVVGFFLFPYLSNLLHLPQMTSAIYTPMTNETNSQSVTKTNNYFSKEYFNTLVKYQTAYLGDNSKVGNLISALPISEYGYSIEILSETLQLNVYYHDVSWNINNIEKDEYYYQKAILLNTFTTFYYIENMEAIQFYFSDYHISIQRDEFNQLFINNPNIDEVLEWLHDEDTIVQKMKQFH